MIQVRRRAAIMFSILVVIIGTNGAALPKLDERWVYPTHKTCNTFLDSIDRRIGEPGWCQGTTDDILCWPAVPPGQGISQPCPIMAGTDPTQIAWRRCTPNGTWEQAEELGRPEGYTNYDDCFTKETEALFKQYYGG